MDNMGLYNALIAAKLNGDSGGGSGFTPTTAQLAAMNSGITSEDVGQIATNTTNISSSFSANGAKNYTETYSGTNDSVGWVDAPVHNITGDVVISFSSLTSDDTDATTCNVRAGKTGASFTSDGQQCSRGNNVHVTLNITAETDYIRIYCSDSYAHSEGDTVSFTGLMVCPKALWDISHNFEEYAMSNVDLTKAVQTIQAWIAAQT